MSVLGHPISTQPPHAQMQPIRVPFSSEHGGRQLQQRLSGPHQPTLAPRPVGYNLTGHPLYAQSGEYSVPPGASVGPFQYLPPLAHPVSYPGFPQPSQSVAALGQHATGSFVGSETSRAYRHSGPAVPGYAPLGYNIPPTHNVLESLPSSAATSGFPGHQTLLHEQPSPLVSDGLPRGGWSAEVNRIHFSFQRFLLILDG